MPKREKRPQRGEFEPESQRHKGETISSLQLTSSRLGPGQNQKFLNLENAYVVIRYTVNGIPMNKHIG